MNKTLAFAIFILSTAVMNVSGGITAIGCIPSTGNLSVDIATAKAIAKGNLAHELGSEVTASSNLKSVTIEKEHSVTNQDTLYQTINIVSKHRINGVKTLDAGYQVINKITHYCVQIEH